MNEDEIVEIFYIILRLAAIVVLVINAGIGLLLLRQVATMNGVLRVPSGALMMLVVLGFLLVVSFSLLYAILT